MTAQHPQQTESEGIHQQYNWIWADETERLAETVVAADINKVGLQQDENTEWLLVDITPTFTCVGGLVRAGADDYAIASGNGAIAANWGETAHSSGYFDDPADSQHGKIHVFREVTHSDANWYNLFTDGLSLYAEVPSYTVMTFEALVVGATASLAKVFAFKIQGCIKNATGVISLSGTPTVTTISDGDDPSFDARAVANNPPEYSLDIEVSDSDAGGDVVRWSAVIKYVSVTFTP